MGTRNLTAVQLDGEYKIAQYGQWDGYPSGQGKTVLAFLKKIKGPRNRKVFEAKLRAASFITDDEIDLINAIIKEEKLEERWQARWPHLSRDMAAEVLHHVFTEPPGIKLKDSISFAGDSLFCEFAYVIDLDKNKFEVYKGFNKRKIAANARFQGKKSGAAEGYHPIRKVAAWSLDKLPTQKEMEKKVGD